jgi:choline dehydrogenase-like flavoprotein
MGIPLLVTSVGHDDNDDRLVKNFLTQSAEMMEKAGCKNIKSRDNHQAPGLDIYEMGGCGMGKDSKTSLLNEWNQSHLYKNVFVSDGACMTSTGNQSPSMFVHDLNGKSIQSCGGRIEDRQFVKYFDEPISPRLLFIVWLNQF